MCIHPRAAAQTARGETAAEAANGVAASAAEAEGALMLTPLDPLLVRGFDLFLGLSEWKKEKEWGK